VKLALLLYKYFPYGGMQRDFRRFVEQIQKRGHHCRIYYISWQGDELANADLRQVPVKALSNHRRNEQYYDWVRKDLLADPVDGVVGFNKMPGLDVYYAADSCYLAKAVLERNWIYRQGARFRHFAAYEQAVFGPQSTTQILLISATEKAKFEQYYQASETRLHMLPPGIDRDRRAGTDATERRVAAREQLLLKHDDIALFFIGSGFIKKGLGRAIRTLAATRSARPANNVQLFVVGQDKKRRFQRLAASLAVADHVHFLGGRDDVADLLLAADLLVHPALDEAAGIVLIEALVAGLPVIVTDVCGYASHIASAGAGEVLVSPFDQKQLDQAVLRALDPATQSAYIQAGLAYAESEDLYSMHRAGAMLIEQIVASSASPAPEVL
jgi:UDP-glucose:(heptosyl)LPS alpha-1,3-glucosyltransferase